MLPACLRCAWPFVITGVRKGWPCSIGPPSPCGCYNVYFPHPPPRLHAQTRVGARYRPSLPAEKRLL